MKPDDLSWFEYLRGYGRLRWRSPGDEQKFHELCGLLQPLYSLASGKVLDKPGPKIVIAEPTHPVVRRKGHPPFTFRVQCLITGRMSTAIPYERMIEFGVLKSDLETGGAFPRDKANVEDRIKPLIEKFSAERCQVFPFWDSPEVNWWERYDEYLQSDEWLAIREKVLRRDNYRCVYTGKAKRPGDPLQVHHLTYERVGCEKMEDLVTVCLSWHQQHHNKQ